MSHQALEKLITDRISLNQSEISRGATSQKFIRTLLDNKSKEDNNLPWLLEGDFLSGSYARHTKIHPLDDIDVMIVMDGQGLFPSSNGVQLDATVKGRELANNPVYSHKNQFGKISSTKILEVFRKYLQITYPDSEIKKDGQAVNVYFPSYKMGLDIVPCFNIVPNIGSKDYYYIPFGRGSDGWMSTNPKIDENICNVLNDKFNKNLKPVIRLIKYWNQNQNNNRLKSYHLEVIIWQIFIDYPYQITNYPVALRHFFSKAAEHIAVSCEDPTKLGDNIDSYLDDGNASRRLTISKIYEVRRLLASVGTLSPLANRLKLWSRIFGVELY